MIINLPKLFGKTWDWIKEDQHYMLSLPVTEGYLELTVAWSPDDPYNIHYANEYESGNISIEQLEEDYKDIVVR